MKIVYLNFADKHGVTEKAVRALRLKYPEYNGWNLYKYYLDNNSVQLFDLVDTFKNNSLSIQQRREISAQCTGADRIMVAIHGQPGDTVNGYIQEFGENIIKVNYRIFAQYILQFLPNRNSEYRISLIMCFGARSEDPLLDHREGLTNEMIKSSFAFKFYRELVQSIRVRMSARTGSIEFHERTGHSMVQTEEAVASEVELNLLQESEEIFLVNQAYEGLKELYLSKYGNIRALVLMENDIVREMESGRTDWSMLSSEQMIILRYKKIKKRINRLTQAKDRSKGKSGKFIYLYDQGNVMVIRKYPEPEILYRGNI